MWDVNAIISKVFEIFFIILVYPIRKIMDLPQYVKTGFYVFVVVLAIALIYWIWKNREAYLHIQA